MRVSPLFVLLVNIRCPRQRPGTLMADATSGKAQTQTGGDVLLWTLPRSTACEIQGFAAENTSQKRSRRGQIQPMDRAVNRWSTKDKGTLNDT